MRNRLRYLAAIGVLAAMVGGTAVQPAVTAYAEQTEAVMTEAPAPETQASTEAQAPETQAPTEAPAPETQPATETPTPETQAPTEAPATEAPKATEAVPKETQTTASEKQTEQKEVQAETQGQTESALPQETLPQQAETEKANTKKEKEKEKETETETETGAFVPAAALPLFSAPVNPNSYPAADITDVTNDLYKFLREEMGLNHAAACGVLANVHLESDFNLFALGDGGTSYGLCQWHNGRWASLVAFCRRSGYDPDTIEGQENYLKHELTGGYSAVYDRLLNVPDTADGAYEAAYYFCYHFEAPNQTEARSKQRGNLAKYEYYPRTYGEDDCGSVIKGIRETDVPDAAAMIRMVRTGEDRDETGIIWNKATVTAVPDPSFDIQEVVSEIRR